MPHLHVQGGSGLAPPRFRDSANEARKRVPFFAFFLRFVLFFEKKRFVPLFLFMGEVQLGLLGRQGWVLVVVKE